LVLTSTIFFFWLCDVAPNTITIYPLRFAPSAVVIKENPSLAQYVTLQIKIG